MTFQNPFVLGWKAAISNILIRHFHQNILNSCLQYHQGWEGELDDDTCQSRPGHLLRCQQPSLEFGLTNFPFLFGVTRCDTELFLTWEMMKRPVLTSDSLNRYAPSLPSSLDSASLHSRHSCILTMNKMSLAMTQLDRLLVYMEMQTDLWLDQFMLSVHTSAI